MKEMKHNEIATIILQLLVFSEIGVAEIVTKPSETEVVVGGSTYLNCSTNSPQEIHWFHTAITSSQGRNFVYGYNQFYSPYDSRFIMEKNEAQGAFNLVIHSVRVEDAGLYECQDEIGRGDKETVELIVLDTDPVCEPRFDTYEIIGPNKCGIEPQQLILSCVVEYHGNVAPILNWRKAGVSASISEEVTHRTTDNNRVVYNLTIKGDSTVEDGTSYFCNTTRSTTTGVGCESGKLKVIGTVAYCPPCDATEICKPYRDAIICFFFIVLPTVIIGTVLVLWYLRVYRRKKGKGKNNEENDAKTQTIDATAEEATSCTSVEDAQAHQQLLNQSGKPSAVAQTKSKNPQEDNDALLKSLNEHKETIKRLKEENDLNKNTVKSQKSGNEKLKAENEQLKVENVQLKVENVQLKVENEQLKDLEQHLYPKENIDYTEKPVLAYTIQLSEKYNGIKGIAVLGNELFVVTEGSEALAVYDSTTFHHEGNRMVKGLEEPLDIATSRAGNCLFIIGKVKVEESEVSESKKVEESEVSESKKVEESEVPDSKIMRLDSKGNVQAHWSIDGGTGRLSTYKSNVILCLFEKQLIVEYSSIGEIIHTVRLSPAAKLNHPLHAIKVTSAHFVVSHGDDKDDLHRVCVVDLDGNIKKECTESEKSGLRPSEKMKVPICLIEDSERSIIVADRNKSRVLLLSSQLKYKRHLINLAFEEHPLRLCFDATQSKLFVAVNKWSSKQNKWKDGRILIYNVK